RVPAYAEASAGRRERVRGALVHFTTESERTMQFQVTTRSARAKRVRAKANTSPPRSSKSINNLILDL
ncbi:MAG: hypothetical protein AAB545_02790, partial [Patescibacteria group bacterium]